MLLVDCMTDRVTKQIKVTEHTHAHIVLFFFMHTVKSEK